MTRGVCLFGGAFNPPHLDHAAILRAAWTRLAPDEIRVLPAAAHPFKAADADMAPFAARAELCRLAFAELPGVVIDEREALRPGPSFTVDTLRELRRALGAATPLYWLLGSDNLPQLTHWREHHEILRLCTVVTYPRADHPCDAQALAGLDLDEAERHAILAHVLPVPPLSLSASAIRRKLHAGQPVDDLLHPAVLARIRALHLYGT